MDNLIDKSIMQIINEMETNQLMNEHTAKDAVDYFTDVSLDGTKMIDEVMNIEQSEKLLVILQTAIISTGIMMEQTVTGKQDLMMMTSSQPMRMALVRAFLAGIGMSAREEIR